MLGGERLSYGTGSGKRPLSANGNEKIDIAEDETGLVNDVSSILSILDNIEGETNNLSGIKADTDNIATDAAAIESNTGGSKADLDKLINALSSIATDSLRVISV